MGIFQKVIEKAIEAGSIELNKMAALAWFKQKLSNFKITQSNIAEEKERASAIPVIGQMYIIEYTAKCYPESIPYYDKFPIILIIDKTPNGFLGLNFHYLPPQFRAVLFQELLKLEKIDFKTKENKIRATMQIMRSYGRYKYFRPCVKRYLYSRVGKIFSKVNRFEWEVCLFLPTERFIGAKKQDVWNDSREIIKKYEKK